MRGLRLALAGAVLLAGATGWYGYHRVTGGFGGPLLSTPAAAPAGRPGQFVVAAFQGTTGTYLINPTSGGYTKVAAPVRAVSPDLAYAVLGEDNDLLVVDTRTGRTVRDLGRARSRDVSWSPDGRRLAISHTTWVDKEDGHIDGVRLLDLVSGADRNVPVVCPSYGTPAWLPDSTGIALVADGPAGYPLVRADGQVSQSPGWPAGLTLYGSSSTQPGVLILHGTGPGGQRVASFDMRQRRVVDEFNAAALPAADQPLPGRPAGVVPMGPLTMDRVLVADGSRLLAWNLRTGAMSPLVSLPHPALGATVLPAAGLSAAAAPLAFRIP